MSDNKKPTKEFILKQIEEKLNEVEKDL